MAQKQVIEIFSEDGEIKQYRPLSQRLPEFLEAFPPSKGFQVVVETADPMSNASILEVYKAAVAAGHKPSDLGLPHLPGGIVFRAKLIDPEGRVLASASAHRFRLDQFKDWEKAETAARQRLLAAVGFGGEILDEDEEGDIRDQGKEVRKPSSKSDKGKSLPPIRPIASPAPPSPALPPDPVPVVEQEEADAPKAEPEQAEEPMAKAKGSKEKPKEESKGDPSGVSEMWLNRLKTTAAAQGINELPTVSSDEEAKKLWKELLTGKYKPAQ